jgi:methylmalonyl-CoA mutase N-terminal domain/subunit
MPLLIDGVKAGLTVGEISGALREVWGEHRESSHL